jgi:rRNA maturation endonuclease Nob1
MSPAVVSARMPGLITNEEVLGDTRIPEEPPVHPSRCPRCRVEVGEAHFCPRCGFAVVVARGRAVGDLPQVRCLECGVPNPTERERCMACGKRM